MTLNRVQALRTQRQLVLDYCAGLSDDDWTAPSHAAGWRVRDVIAHMGGTCRGLFSRHAVTLIFSDDTEQTNEDLLAPRRAWPTDRILDEFARWSKAFIAAASAAGQPLLGSTPLRVGSLGSYPLRKLASMLVFDWHTHLTYDLAPAINRPAPAIDDSRLAATLEWMLTGLEQMNRDQMRWLDKSLTLTLTGPAGRDLEHRSGRSRTTHGHRIDRHHHRRGRDHGSLHRFPCLGDEPHRLAHGRTHHHRQRGLRRKVPRRTPHHLTNCPWRGLAGGPRAGLGLALRRDVPLNGVALFYRSTCVGK